MPRPKHYVPCISRNLVCALYHEAKARRMPMTRLVNELLTAALVGTPGWQIAHTITSVAQRQPHSYADQRAQAA
jgi:hypothetical protein